MNQAEKQFSFDLQIFADEAADVSTPEVTETAEPAQEPAPAPTDSAPEPEKHISEMTDDEQTEYIKRHFLDDKQPKKEEPKEEPGQAVTQPEQKPEEPTFEITVGGEKKQVTQSELISLAQKGEDYTRKTQALAEQRRQLEAQALQFQQMQQMQQQRQPQPPQNPGDRVKAEYQAAVAIAEKQLGLQPGEFNQFDPEHAFMLQNVIIRANMMQGQQMAERNAVASEIRDFSDEIRKDPMTKQISDAYEEWILRRGLESPEQGKAASAVAMAYSRFNQGNPTRQDCRVLKEHWNYVKKQLQKANNPVTPPIPQKPIIKPPQTEAPGVGRSANQGGGVLDTRKLRGLSSDPDRQMAYMKSLGIFND